MINLAKTMMLIIINAINDVIDELIDIKYKFCLFRNDDLCISP